MYDQKDIDAAAERIRIKTDTAILEIYKHDICKVWEAKKLKLDLWMLELYKQHVKDKAVIAAFKKNSSFFMRRAGDPLIFKVEGVTKDNIIDWIIMAGKRLDEADVDYQCDYYVPVPDWFEQAVDPI